MASLLQPERPAGWIAELESLDLIRAFMDSTIHRTPRVAAMVVVYYFIGFTALCWLLDFAFSGKHETQRHYRLFFDAGLITGLLTLICSGVLWRSQRRLAVVGLLACLLWIVWAALPRL